MLQQDTVSSQFFCKKTEKISHEMTMTSREANQEGKRFGFQLMGYTSMARLFRFAIVAAILIAFHARCNMLLVWSRQWVMRGISILISTKGCCGVTRGIFTSIPCCGFAILAEMLWRLIFYHFL